MFYFDKGEFNFVIFEWYKKYGNDGKFDKGEIKFGFW